MASHFSQFSLSPPMRVAEYAQLTTSILVVWSEAVFHLWDSRFSDYYQLARVISPYQT
jgi:hypothetical protein